MAEHRRKKFPAVVKIVLIFFAAFLAFVILRMRTMEAELSFTPSYTLPQLPAVEITMPAEGQLAVAVNGKLIANENGNISETPRPIASTAKIITALMVMEEKPFSLEESGGQIVLSQSDYDRYAWYLANDGSTTAVAAGEIISEYDALSSMLIASSNNMADSLAIWAFSSLENYRNFANSKLKEWGLNNTTVGSDASGYSDNTTSTAADLAVLSYRLMQNPVLAKIVGTKTYIVPVAGILENTNQLLGQQGIVGVKTGYNGDVSGYCLLSAYNQGSNVVTLAYLGASTRQDSFKFTSIEVNYLQTNLTDTEFIKSGTPVGSYDAWWLEEQPVTSTQDLSALAWQASTNSASVDMQGASGTLSLEINGTQYSVPVSAGKLKEAPDLWQRFLHVFGWEV